MKKVAKYSASRIAIEQVYPEIDQGRFPAKRIVGEPIEIWADIFMDGHELLHAVVAYCKVGEASAEEIPMVLHGNDRWSAVLPITEAGRYQYSIIAWPDRFGSWRRDTLKKHGAGQDIALELQESRILLESMLGAKKRVWKEISVLDPLTEGLDEIARMHDPRVGQVAYPALELLVEGRRAEFSAWYELFPRNEGGFAGVEKRLPQIREMGFDVLYFTPIHPIGQAFRKGKNNAPSAQAGEPGSPYAIGSSEGGHKAVHPELGTLEDFQRLVQAAHAMEMDVALDFAVQCSPDHPYMKEHPEWFRFRPDGSMKYAENPPKKYQDIVNVDFECADAEGLWQELRSVVEFWIEQGVMLFRVDNPHTKPFAFWEWLISEIHATRPDIIFLSEAFTRPKIMYRLAKLGFAQSYSYFTWRNTKTELTEYLTELTTAQPKEFFRPNFFPVTPDIFPTYLHESGKAGYMVRLALAATLGSNYGMLSGYELCEGGALEGKEEYHNSEKYEIRQRDWDRPDNIIPFVTALNRIRKENPALQQFKQLRFLHADNDQILFYVKWSTDRSNVVFVAVNLDYANAHEASIYLPLWEFGIKEDAPYTLDDLMLGHSWQWQGASQHLRLDPLFNPVAIFRLHIADSPLKEKI